MMTTTRLDAFRQAIEKAGLVPPSLIPPGKLIRFPGAGKSNGNTSGWAKLFVDEQAGVYGDWASDLSETWHAEHDHAMTAAERAAHTRRVAELRRIRQEEEANQHAEAAQRASMIWEAAPAAENGHPYLKRKGVQSHGLRTDPDGRLIIPVTINGAILSLQFIDVSGGKQFLPGGKVRGGTFTFGDLTEAATVLICEGYATAASLYAATGYPTVCAFSANNLLPVAQQLHQQYPAFTPLIAGDHDLSGTGQREAHKAAAAAIGGLVALPEIPGQDWNDVHVQCGLDAVRQAIDAALTRERETEMMTTNTAPPYVSVPDPAPSELPALPASLPLDSWPVLEAEALYGLAGDVVRLIEPHTEADPVALLVSFISEAGTLLNRGPHLILDGVFHPLLFWPVLVGNSSKSRKGTAGKRIQTLMGFADPSWTRGEAKGTLSSGEGLAYAVRDPQHKEEPVKKGGQPTGETVTILVDSGVGDKRLFLVQSEFGSVLRVMGREGNSLSGVLRDAWDGQTLAPMTKANRVRATDPHIGLVAHVTNDELLRNLTDTEASNGFGNRFCWFAVRRSKELPFPSTPSREALESLALRIGRALQRARSFGEIGLTNFARDAWKSVYHDLSADHPGMAGTLLARGEAHVMRLAALYAVLDGHASIDLVHLKAGLSLWQYAEESTRRIFGDSLGNPIADTILRALRASKELTDSQVSDLFGRHLPSAKLEQAKTVLLMAGLAHCVSVETGGRPRIVWRAGAK